MFLSEKNQHLLIELVEEFSISPRQNIFQLMKQYYVNADKRLSILDLNKEFLLTLKKTVAPVSPVAETIPVKETERDPEISKNMEAILLEISFIKQEMNEIKKMLILVPQLINNFTVAKNTDSS